MLPIRVLLSRLAALATLLLAPAFVGAATIHVETLSDELTTNTFCSLREALMNANANNSARADCEGGSGADLIDLMSGQVELAIAGREENGNATGDLDITESVTLRGLGAGISTIDANGIDRVLHILVSAANVTIEDLTVTGGAAILSDTEQFGGGGIMAAGAVLTIRRSDIYLNNATSSSGFLSVSGGGIFFSSTGTTMSIEDSSLRNNSVTDTSPGIGVQGGGFATFNTASLVSLIRSTLSANSVSTTQPIVAYGGGLLAWGGLNIENSTISGNSATNGNATSNGGGIYYQDPGAGPGGVFKNLTLANNAASVGSGLFLSGGADFRNSVIAANNCSGGTVTSLGGNLESPGASCGLGLGVDDQENVTAGALNLGPLQYNGGYADTRELLAGSVAINKGTAAPCPATDERGVARTAPCDSGAYEANLIFSDGFGTANFSAWSSHQP